ncbi:hypothetical protein GCM10010210_45540 [Pseudonocardia hydrocarbonoxydans]|uniref:Uncharacterized protein n=1 Tax=Pseudonocardia hydrocarbonoxydans TaxID=76726 RepID=A0A4Y3WWC7_9PSEU|nr:hypothetical protein PHY01_48740 [Pseudonocardia hydrocarbonoxydans]
MDAGDQLSRLLRTTAYCGAGQTIGPIAAACVDDADRPAWVCQRPDLRHGETVNVMLCRPVEPSGPGLMGPTRSAVWV